MLPVNLQAGVRKDNVQLTTNSKTRFTHFRTAVFSNPLSWTSIMYLP
jgi:hypothetical protein